MTFVHVPYLGVVTHRTQGTHAAYAQQYLLGDTQIQIAAVKPGCQGTIGG